MSDLSIGAVGAAFVAGLVSLLGLVIGKEQKVSEFRQAWIDELRKCFITYLVNINAIANLLQIQKADNTADKTAFVSSYKLLNEASHGIKLRINKEEQPAKAVLKQMAEFENIAKMNVNLTPTKVGLIEKDFLKASQKLLKFEWRRVKTGEKVFIRTKWSVIALILITLSIMIYFIIQNERQKAHTISGVSHPQFLTSFR